MSLSQSRREDGGREHTCSVKNAVPGTSSNPSNTLSWGLWSVLAAAPSARPHSAGRGPGSPVGSLGWLWPQQRFHPTVRSLISQRRGLPGNEAGDWNPSWLAQQVLD